MTGPNAMEAADYAGEDSYEVVADWTQGERQAYMHPREAAAVTTLFEIMAAVLERAGYKLAAQRVVAWLSGGTLNIRLTKGTLTYAQLRKMPGGSYYEDPIAFNHHGHRSLDQLFKTWRSGHWGADPNGVEFHINLAGPLNPVHWPSFLGGLFGDTWKGNYQCARATCK